MAGSAADDDTLWIISTRDPDGVPVCQLTWHGVDWYASVAEVRETAGDLMTCAAYAEMMMTLLDRLDLDAGTVTAFMTDLLRGRKKRYFGTPATITLMPAGSSARRVPVVLIKRGLTAGETEGVSPDKARQMAVDWLAVAEATESDQLVGEALRAVGVDDSTQARLFGYLMKLRERR